ncbi:hypothetical protein EV426DRAFT_700947 [Tirmania nivea]|nr:hypothetical protein EV426DRAFT_700947 [Tirmania nivea]
MIPRKRRLNATAEWTYHLHELARICGTSLAAMEGNRKLDNVIRRLIPGPPTKWKRQLRLHHLGLIPLKNASEYTEDRVRQGLAFADSILRNKIQKLSPLGQIALGLYKDSCARYLDIEDGEALDETEVAQLRAEWIATIRAHENSFMLMACLRLTNTQDAQQLQDELVDMMRTRFYARYGDYFAQVSTQLKSYAEANTVPGWQAVAKSYWTDIATRLRDEAKDYAKSLKGEVVECEQIPTHTAIRHACRAIGFDLPNTISIINHYATRNELVHTNLLQFIKEGSFKDLSTLLYRDLRDLPLILSLTDREDYALMYSLIEIIIDTWYVRPETQPDRDNDGLCSEVEKVNKEMRTEIMTKLRKYKRILQEEETVQEQAKIVEEVITVGGATVKRKRVASSQFQEESIKLQKRKRDWNKIININFQTQK